MAITVRETNEVVLPIPSPEKEEGRRGWRTILSALISTAKVVAGQALRPSYQYGVRLNLHPFSTIKEDEEREQLAKEISKE